MDNIIVRVRRKRLAPSLSAVVLEPPSKRTRGDDEYHGPTMFAKVHSGPVSEPYSVLQHIGAVESTSTSSPASQPPFTLQKSNGLRLIQESSSRMPLFVPGVGFVVDAVATSMEEPSVVEDEVREDEYLYDYYVKTEAHYIDPELVGFLEYEPFSFGDTEYLSDQDSEDSNAEDFYGNDYPDEEDMLMPDITPFAQRGYSSDECLTSDVSDAFESDDDGFEEFGI
ncbi:hypothetical protein RCL1_001034 [Eukaryota sp. TZLM3-RCL]